MFFSLSLGMGAMITYGSYLDRKQNLEKNALTPAPPPRYADSTAHTSRPPVVFRCETAGGLSLRRRNTGERTDYGRSMLGTMLPSVTARTARRMMLS